MKIRIALALSLFAACDKAVEEPSPNPPATWGVPISGGTMLVTRDGKHAVIADPDRDRLLAIELASDTVINEVALAEHDEPGRLVEDGAGRIHVALRRGGSLLTLASPAATTPERRAACAEPRGLAWDRTADTIHVACATGELVTFPAAGGEATRRLRLDRDLRDVIVDGDRLVLTRFRSAEILTLDAAGAIVTRAQPPIVQRSAFSFDGPVTDDADGLVDAIPAVAWRSVALADGRVLVVHQRQLKKQLETTPGGYGGGCGDQPIETALAVVRPGEAPVAVTPVVNGTLPVDIAVAPSGGVLAIALAGTQSVRVVNTSALATPDENTGGCGGGGHDAGPPIDDELGAPTAIAYTPDDTLLVYYPEVPALAIHRGGTSRTIQLPGELGYDSGRQMFHQQTGSGLSCASCHPEGRDDGLIWDFADLGIRRTQSLAGGILQRAPYHWAGDMTDLSVLMDDVFGGRMNGGPVSRSQKLSLGPWLDRIPAPAPSPIADPAAIARGQRLFDSAELACASCHNGAQLTNNQLYDVGTGGMMKVPSLRGVAARAPFMHTGCAPTLHDRFAAGCGGGDYHGKTSALTEPELADLVAYLESL